MTGLDSYISLLSTLESTGLILNSKQQLYYAKDKARARMTLILIAMTILGSLGAIFIGKIEQKAGKRHSDDILREHAQYSQAHRDQIRHSRD